METYIKISTLNDFIFCPKSIYFHELYNKYNQSTYHGKYQTEGKLNHESIDKGFYSNKKDILQGITVYSHKYKLLGKIDIYDKQTKTLIERKTNIKKIYLGYIYQLWAQYLCMQEMGFKVEKIQLYSLKTNKKFDIELPKGEELKKFKTFLQKYQNFNIKQFKQKNPTKCQMCIYRTLCDIAL